MGRYQTSGYKVRYKIRMYFPVELNPAKQTDTRYQNYVEEFGDSSWELDAIEPIELANLIRNEVLNLRADDLWEKNVELENSMREELRSFADNYGVNND